MRPHVALSLVCVAHTGEPSETADRDAVWGAESFEPNKPSAHWRNTVSLKHDGPTGKTTGQRGSDPSALLQAY